MSPRKAKMQKPKTPLAKRLCQIFGEINFSEKSPEYDVSTKTLKGYLVGDVDPPASFLSKVEANLRVTADWLISGKSNNPQSISYAFFPISEEKEFKDQRYYFVARELAAKTLFSLFKTDTRPLYRLPDRSAEVIAILLHAANHPTFQMFTDRFFKEKQITREGFEQKEFELNLPYHEYAMYVVSAKPDKELYNDVLYRLQKMQSCFVNPDIQISPIRAELYEVTGCRFREVRQTIWPDPKDFMRIVRCNEQQLNEMETKGIGISFEELSTIAECGGDVAYILTGIPSPALWSNPDKFLNCLIDETPIEKEIDFNTDVTGILAEEYKKLKSKHSEFSVPLKPLELPVIGNAAADNDQASRAEFYDDGDYETVQIAKEHYRLVRVHGDSMEPVVLDGQYVLIGSEIRKTEKIRKQGIICVVQVDCSNHELPEEITGCAGGICTYTKRVHDMGDSLLLTSINASACSPFTVMKANVMHIWPIKGVIFANHGNIPED